MSRRTPNVTPSADLGDATATVPIPEAVEAVVESVQAEAMLLVSELEAVMARVEHDITGQVHALWLELKALVAGAKAAV